MIQAGRGRSGDFCDPVSVDSFTGEQRSGHFSDLVLADICPNRDSRPKERECHCAVQDRARGYEVRVPLPFCGSDRRDFRATHRSWRSVISHWKSGSLVPGRHHHLRS